MSGHSRPSSRGKEVFSHVLTDRQGQVQNVKAARVYVFGDGNVPEDGVDETVEFEMPAIRTRRGQSEGARSVFQEDEEEEEFYEKEIVEGETLQSLSLKYACPVSELKRVNKLMKDQDFFALRQLKIPMRRHGILSELVQRQEQEAERKRQAQRQKPFSHRNGSTTTTPLLSVSDSDIPSDTAYSDMDVSDAELRGGSGRSVRTLSICDNFSSRRGQRDASRFFRRMDKDLSNLRQSTVTQRESLDEVISVLTNKSFHPLASGHNRQGVSGADWGMRWWVVVIVAVAVCVMVPLIYIIYVNFFRDSGTS